MRKRKNKIYLTVSIIVLILLFFLFIQKKMENREYYVCESDGSPRLVSELIKTGYKIIGRFKLQNPHPFEFTEAEFDTILIELPQWVKKNILKFKLTLGK